HASHGIPPLSLHDALPICSRPGGQSPLLWPAAIRSRFFHSPIAARMEIWRTSVRDSVKKSSTPSQNFSRSESLLRPKTAKSLPRSEEHTSELQSRGHLVCR